MEYRTITVDEPKKIKKISDNTYIEIGGISFFRENIKTVVVDGEKFHKSTFEDVKTTIEDLYESNKEYFYTMEIDEFELFGVNPFFLIKIRDGAFTNNMGISQGGSQNGYINTLINLVDERIPELKTVKDIYTGKKEYERDVDKYKRIERDLIECSYIEIPLLFYGWNNTLWIRITFVDFIKLNFKRLSESRYRFLLLDLIKCNILPNAVFEFDKITPELKRQIMLKLFYKKIEYYRIKRQQKKSYLYY